MGNETHVDTADAARGRYHHGELRQALIDASMRLIEETSVERFSVAQAARAAGVSSGAPYRHFTDRDDLLDAVAAEGFLALEREGEAAWSAHPPGSVEGLIAGGCAYIRFGATRPELFHLMWGATRSDGGEERARRTGSACHEGFLRRFATVLEAQELEDLDIMAVSTPLWAMVHGYASLLIGRNPKLTHDMDVIASQVTTMTKAYLTGLCSNH